MARRKTLTDNMVAKLKPGPKRLTLPDPELRGHYLRVTPTGAKSYVAVARAPGGKQVWATIGGADVLTIGEARERARAAIQRIKDGLEPFEAPPPEPDSFKAVAENYVERHVKANRLRSQAEIERILDTHMYPSWKDREFASIRRGDVTRLLDMVQDANGPGAADHVLAIVRGIMNWYASRSDDYISPIARGMRRTDPKSRKRARILDDDEIRAVWKVAEANGTFGAIIRLALLTAQRREKIATVKWQDVTIDGVWDIQAEDREKGNGGALVLPETALAIIREQTRIGENPYVFAGRGDGHFKGYSPCKRAFDVRVTKALSEVADGEPLPRWTLHDLRRTARSLMARAGVRPDIAERVMGHTIPGVEGVYDRHTYRDEKADALKRLAGLIALILDPPANNVMPLHAEV
ncbi:MAG: integrase family protein [Proteobacteria bacterium]|nr:integrase family protein [Pseudomonadota bacterium]